MKNLFKKIKAVSLFEVVCGLVAGILFIACPNFAKSTIVYIFGAFLLAIGLVKVVNYFLYSVEPFGLLLGCANSALGIAILSSAEYLATGGTFGFIFGLIFIVKSLFQMQWAITCGKFGVKNWWYDLIVSALILTMGILLICYTSMEDVLMYFLGAVMILSAVYTLIDTLFVSVKIKKVKRTFKDLLEKEGNVIEIDNDDEQEL